MIAVKKKKSTRGPNPATLTLAKRVITLKNRGLTFKDITSRVRSEKRKTASGSLPKQDNVAAIYFKYKDASLR